MDDWDLVEVRGEGVLGDRRVGCSSLLVGHNDLLVQGALRQWPDDGSLLRLSWEVRDQGSGELLTSRGGGYGGGSLPGETFAYAADCWFDRGGASAVVVSCSLNGQTLLEVAADLTVCRAASHEVSVLPAHTAPTSRDRAALDESLAQRWPSVRAIADRIERIGRTVSVGGADVDLLGLEHWGWTRRLMVNLPSDAYDTPTGPPRWWTVSIDGVEYPGVADGVISGPTGLVGHLIVLDV